MGRAHILVVDDEADIRLLVEDILKDEDYTVSVASGAAQARDARRDARHDLILLDIWMPDTDGITLLREWSDAGLDVPVVMMSGHGTIETAVAATRLGAYDFIEKPLSLAKLLLVVARALESSQLRSENQGLKQQLPQVAEPIGASALMQQLRSQAERAARSDAAVLLKGESGAGKESLARWIHQRSARSAGPFIPVLPATLARDHAAAVLFGTERGSEVRYGLLERAQGGTLYLAEIGLLDADTQRKLAAALASRSITRLGGSAPVALNLRVIAGTTSDLALATQQGNFLDALYYAIQVLQLSVPALRNRPEDVPELAQALIDFFVSRDRLPYRRFTISAQNRLRQYPWPGNVRELANMVQRLLIMGQGSEIDVGETDAGLGPIAPRLQPDGQSLALDLSLPLRDAREQFEREYLLHQLRLAQGSVGKMAKAVGLERTHLYRKLRTLGVEPKDPTE